MNDMKNKVTKMELLQGPPPLECTWTVSFDKQKNIQSKHEKA